MSRVTASPRITKQPGDNRLYTMDYTADLASGETLTGSPTVAGSPSGLTIGSPSINTSTIMREDGTTIAVGKAVQVRISGGTDGIDYRVQFSCGTSDGNTKVHDGILQVSDD